MDMELGCMAGCTCGVRGDLWLQAEAFIDRIRTRISPRSRI